MNIKFSAARHNRASSTQSVGSHARRSVVRQTPSYVPCARVIVGLLFVAGSAKFSFAQEFEPREFEARAARHERHAATGQAEARAERHARAAAAVHGHHRHRINATTTATSTTATATNPTTQKSPPPAGGDPKWTGLGGNVNWSTGGNWDSTPNPPTSSATTDLVFAGTTNTGTSGIPLNQDIATPMNLRSITFDATAGNFFLGGGQIGNGNGTTLTITQSSSNTQNIANAITQTATTSNGTMTLTLAATTSGTVTLSGVISDNSGNPNRKIAIAANGGTFILSGNNTYTAGTTISGGTLEFAKTNSMPSAGSVSVSSGATLAVNVGGTGEWTNGTSGGGTLGGLISGTGGQGTANQVSWASGSVLGIDTTNASGGNFTYGGVIGSFRTGGNSVGLTKLGSNTLTLTAANTYTGGTTVNGGTLLVNGSTASGSAVTVNNSGTLLGGTGTVGGATTINGPAGITGATNGTVGTLTLGSTLAFSGSSGNLAKYFVDLSGATSDKLAITSSLNLSGAFDAISFSGTANGTTTYVLATYASHTGTFDTVTNLPSGYQLVYGATALDLVPVPEPSTWIAGALALASLVFTQRRRILHFRKRRL